MYGKGSAALPGHAFFWNCPARVRGKAENYCPLLRHILCMQDLCFAAQVELEIIGCAGAGMGQHCSAEPSSSSREVVLLGSHCSIPCRVPWLCCCRGCALLAVTHTALPLCGWWWNAQTKWFWAESRDFFFKKRVAEYCTIGRYVKFAAGPAEVWGHFVWMNECYFSPGWINSGWSPTNTAVQLHVP